MFIPRYRAIMNVNALSRENEILSGYKTVSVCNRCEERMHGCRDNERIKRFLTLAYVTNRVSVYAWP